jgi:hypothetical protein
MNDRNGVNGGLILFMAILMMGAVGLAMLILFLLN